MAVAAATLAVGLVAASGPAAATASTTAEDLRWDGAGGQQLPPANWNQQYVDGTGTENLEPNARISKPGEPVRAGSHSVRFQLREDDPLFRGGARAELSSEQTRTGEAWYGFSTYLADGWAPDPAGDIVTQWHHQGENWSPPLSINTKDGQWEISRNFPGEFNDTPIGAYKTGVWTDWVVHVVWSDGPDGRLQIWKDGRPVPGFADFRGRTNHDDDGTYMKIGVYKWPWASAEGREQSTTTSRVLFHDELRVRGAEGSYAAVDPAQAAAGRTFTAPAPRIRGTAAAGKTVWIARGTWTPSAGVRFTYRWYRDGAPIAGATSTHYRLTAADRGKKVTVAVAGRKAGYAMARRVSPAVTVR